MKKLSETIKDRITEILSDVEKKRASEIEVFEKTITEKETEIAAEEKNALAATEAADIEELSRSQAAIETAKATVKLVKARLEKIKGDDYLCCYVPDELTDEMFTGFKAEHNKIMNEAEEKIMPLLLQAMQIHDDAKRESIKLNREAFRWFHAGGVFINPNTKERMEYNRFYSTVIYHVEARYFTEVMEDLRKSVEEYKHWKKNG